MPYLYNWFCLKGLGLDCMWLAAWSWWHVHLMSCDPVYTSHWSKVVWGSMHTCCMMNSIKATHQLHGSGALYCIRYNPIKVCIPTRYVNWIWKPYIIYLYCAWSADCAWPWPCTQLKLSQWNLSKEVTVLGSHLSIYVGQLKLQQVAVLDRCHCMINVHSIIW